MMPAGAGRRAVPGQPECTMKPFLHQAAGLLLGAAATREAPPVIAPPAIAPALTGRVDVTMLNETMNLYLKLLTRLA